MVQKANPLETFKDLGSSTVDQMKSEMSKLPENFMDQLFGVKIPQRKYSGEIELGESVEFSEIFSGKREEIIKLKKQEFLERKLLQEEKIQVEKKTNELKLQLKAIQNEIITFSVKVGELAQETKIAAMQAPVEPGVYHVIFFEKLLEFIKSFGKKIEEAQVWLHAVNKRAQKKNAWGANYKKHGAKYLLSSEHYLQRSAG
mgnify:CR=1 FL=1